MKKAQWASELEEEHGIKSWVKKKKKGTELITGRKGSVRKMGYRSTFPYNKVATLNKC